MRPPRPARRPILQRSERAMWKVRPAQTSFGCLTLLVGVEAICFVAIVVQTILISVCSSLEPLSLMGLKVSPTIQVLCAAWAMVGIPMSVCAGVGALYRIEYLVKIFFWYLILSFPFGVAVPAWLLASGKVCDSIVEQEIQRMGSAFVCGFTETFVFMWSMVAALVHSYFVYVVWSAAEEINDYHHSSPSLAAYNSQLQFMANAAPATPGAMLKTSMGVHTPLMSLLQSKAEQSMQYGGSMKSSAAPNPFEMPPADGVL
eukprot:TRINITY_DN2916_c0_g1_i2.p1 TRINITY_DN2916_c0_g1~~TRINITY_DN2916_c0_g1_i2.p1  ORF type:complete len:259 (-),score=40.37 TRINITY_DN2916_c0_g1_i2:92-868(-)